MNKQTFMDELIKGLSAGHVEDADDILAQYEEHFMRKNADGYTEEEIASKLGDPAVIAEEYEAQPNARSPKKANIPLAIGFAFLDIFAVLFFAVAFAWVIALLVGALSFLFTGFCLVAVPAFPPGVLIIPYIPYVSGAMLGIAILSLGVLMGVLTAYSFLLAKKSAAAFFKWQKALYSGKKTVPYAVFPLANGKPKRVLRRITLTALAVFAVLFAAAFILMVIQAGTFGFWHKWGWFYYVAQ